MPSKSQNPVTLIVLCGAIVFFAGCHKRTAVVPPTPPAAPSAPAAPTVTLNASPSDITQGASTTLTWSSSNATQVTLAPDIGTVSVQGSRQVNPEESTTYTITAMGSGGRAEASARVTVSAAPAASSDDLNDMFWASVGDAFFNYNKSDIRPDAREPLTKDAEFLKWHPEIDVTVEGHCDERGSEEYNLGLGDRRAEAAKKYMVSLGIADDRVRTTSYGKERPFCTEHDEPCWQQNRRAHLVKSR
jgi:peptidoglycan-associated lipoprotein